MYKQFWGISSIDQGQFVVDRVLSGINKQITVQENLQRSQTWNYFLGKNTEKRTERIQVCRNIFYETLQVKETFVRYALQASKMGVAKKDQRGTNAPKHKMSQAEQKGIQDYINMFPKVESHYIKKESKKIFVAGKSNFNRLAITRMYELYREMCLTNGTLPLSYELHKREFKTIYIAIHKPKRDQCKRCTVFNNKTPTEHGKRNMTDIYRRKIKPNVFEKIKHAKKNPETIAITFDLSAVLFTPCTKVSTLCYKRKLCTYNLTMFSLANKEGHCFL